MSSIFLLKPVGRFKAFEGVPAPYDTRKRQVVPAALKVLRLKNYRKYCVLGELCQQVGWKRQELVEKLETKRKERSKNFYKRKLDVLKKRKVATNHAEFKDLRERLSKLGY
jgi:large subunit ribosomal protein L13Ae